MSNITDYTFVLYERLASQKLNEILSALNSHNHGSSGGVSIDINGAFSDYSFPGTKIAYNSITSNHIVDGTIQSSDLAAGAISGTVISNGTIEIQHLDLSSIKLSAAGYAVYAP